MQRFLPPVSPTKVKMLEPWKDMQDDIIEIPDGAGLSDHTRNDLVELWTSGDDIGIHDPYTPVYPPRYSFHPGPRFSTATRTKPVKPYPIVSSVSWLLIPAFVGLFSRSFFTFIWNDD